MALSEIRTAVNENLESSNFPDLTAAKMLSFINSAQRWVCNGILFLPNGRIYKHSFSFMETESEAETIDGQRRYDLPVEGAGGIWEFKEEINCELIDYNSYRKPLTKLYKKDIEDRTKFIDITDTGIPTHYCIDQYDLWLYPIPEHASNNDTAFKINLDYYGYLPGLSEDDDENYLTKHYPEVLEWKATALGFQWQKDELAAYFENKAKERLLEMILEDEKKVGGPEQGLRPATGQSLAPP